uniref:Mitochondrial import receptor subunit TOM7 homolog n=1 Tax=Salarias fasciatus TaxID=181472 RepID=A0A672HF15_SALFA
MAKMSKETKQRLQQLFQCGQFVIRWGFIPTVLYLGQYPDRSEGRARVQGQACSVSISSAG